MLVFHNKHSGNYFLVDNTTGKVELLREREHITFKKFAHFIGHIDYLVLKDLTEVNKFRRIITKGVLKDVPLAETRDYLVTHYPEYFI